MSDYIFGDPFFYARELLQTSYDREIDEGMSSGLKRFATIDLTDLPDNDRFDLINGLCGRYTDFGLCKLVWVIGFEKEDRAYVIITGEFHRNMKPLVVDKVLEKAKEVTNDFPVEYIEEHIDLKVERT